MAVNYEKMGEFYTISNNAIYFDVILLLPFAG